MAEDTVLTEEQNIKSMWTALQVAEGQIEKRGLKFGEAMYEYREKHSAQGRRTDLVTPVTKSETFEEFCDRLGIVRMTAYRWVARYEESNLPKPDSSEIPIAEPESEPEPTPPAAPAPTTPVVSREEQDRKQLRCLVKRLSSISKALQQVVDDAKWSQYEEEYDEVVSSGKKIAVLVELL